MKRFLLVLLLSCFSLLVPTLSQAQELPNLTMRCLNPTIISKTKSEHFVKLDGAGFEPNTAVEVWRQTTEGFVCAIDKNGLSLCGDQALSANNNGKDFQIINLTKDQVVANANGEVHIDRVHSRTKKRLNHFFYGAQKTAPVATTTGTPELSASQYSLKLMTFLEQQQQEAPSELANCVSVFFDPYGRVFDTVSLEPVPQVAVWLLDNSKNALPNQPGVTNPNNTEVDGSFSFFVPDGTYYLDPKSSTHLFPVEATEITNLYQKQSVYYDLYLGEPIVQQGAIQHRDIPLQPKDINNPTNTQPVIMDQTITEIWENGVAKQRISGVVSHPKSLVNIFSGSRLLDTTETNSQGVFETLIDNGLIDQTLPLDLIAEKVSLLNDDVLGAQAQNQSNKVQLFPRPSFLIGYIYDANQLPLPNGVVKIVIPQMNNTVYAVTKSDSYGFVTIPNQLIPQVDYELWTIVEGRTNKQTIQDFVTQNKTFLEQEKINLLNPQNEITARVLKKSQEQGSQLALQYTAPIPTPTTTVSQQNNESLPLYIVLTLLVTIAIALLIIALNRYSRTKDINLQG